MAAESTFTLTFKTIAELTGITQLNGAVSSVGKTVEGVKTQIATATAEANAALASIAGKANAALGTAGGTTRSTLATSVAAEEAKVSAELIQQTAIESQLQVIAQTRLELAAALAAGDKTQANVLRAELGVRAATLGVMRTEALTQAELAALTEREAALLALTAREAQATAAGGLLAGANLGRARQEAMVLGRELATGTVRASTLGSLIGATGTVLSVAGLAAYELYHGISSAVEAAEKMHSDVVAVVQDIGNAVNETARLARESETVGDTIKIADKWNTELAQVSVKMAEFRQRELGFWASFVDKIVEMFGSAWNALVDKIPGLGMGVDSTGPFHRAAQKDVDDAKAAAQQAIVDANNALETSMRSRSEWGKAMADPAQGVAAYTKKVEELQAKLATINRSTPEGLKQYGEVLKDLYDAEGKLDQLGNAQDKLSRSVGRDTSATDALAAAKFRLASAEETYKTQVEETKLLEDSGAISSQQAQHRNADAAREFIAQLERERATLPALIAEQQALGNTKGVQQLTLEYQKLTNEILKTKIATQSQTTFGQIGAAIRQLSAEWGNLGKQIGGVLTQTFQNFANTAGQAITGLIFRTGNLKQAIMSVAQSFVQSMITMVIQWVLSRTIMSALNRVFGESDTQAASEQAGQAAAAWAPAATAASIASYGAAAGLGLTAYLAAIATGTAGTVAAAGAGGGFRVGGFTGHGADSDYAGPAHKNEFYFSAPATRFFGVEFLENMHSMALTKPGYQNGGFTGGSAGAGGGAFGSSRPVVNIFHVMNEDELRERLLNAPKGHNIVVDVVNRRRVDLGHTP